MSESSNFGNGNLSVILSSVLDALVIIGLVVLIALGKVTPSEGLPIMAAIAAIRLGSAGMVGSNAASKAGGTLALLVSGYTLLRRNG